MQYVAVLVAAAAGFGVGAIWYNVFSKQWIAASGIPIGPDGKPEGGALVPMIGGFLCILLVAGMMRHTFGMAGIDSVGKGLVGGLGIGLFFITPWITLNVLFSARPRMLAVIDGGYATASCAVIGAVLTLF